MTWSAEQNEDMKFKLRRAEFSNVTGEVTLTNDTLGTRTLKNNALRTTNGSKVIRVFHPNHNMHGTSNNVTIANVPSNYIKWSLLIVILMVHTQVFLT